ncbi:MAG: hypothetical protein OEW05_11890 [Candidatus Aminicenantes bacterium]|nr:hypothetical protein [Candidatus Aminicenantes bacterium]
MRRRLWPVLIAGAILAAAVPARPQSVPSPRSLGLGIMIGDPSGLNLKSWTGRRSAFDIGLAWSFVENSSLQIHADLLFHEFGQFRPRRGRLGLYFGLGGRVKTKEEGDTTLSVRIPLGLTYIFERAPLDLFFEVVPLLDLTPATRGDVQGAVGVRYYF